MSYTNPDAGEDFSARVIFMLDGPVPLRWACTHEFSTNVGGSSANIDTFVGSLKDFHIALLNPAFQVEKIVVSTLAEDSAPYDPTTFKVYTLGEFGTRSSLSDIYALEQCLLVARIASSGRNGHMLLRGFLNESDVSSVGGKPSLNDLSAVQGEVNGAATTSSLDSYLSPAAPTDVQLYMITAGLLDNTEREISQFTVQRMTNKKLNNKYFDKA